MPNTCSTKRCQSTETLTNHGHAITITANSLPQVITSKGTTAKSVFDPFSHQAHLLQCFALTDLILATAWFIALQVWHFPFPATFPSCVSLSAAAASLFCIPAMPLKVKRAECIDNLRFCRVCALSWGVWVGVEEATEEQKDHRRDREGKAEFWQFVKVFATQLDVNLFAYSNVTSTHN